MATRDKTVKVNIDGDASGLIRAAAAGRAALSGLHNEIDKTNDRTAWLAQGVLALAPAVTSLGAAAVPVLSGLATQMTVGVAAAGTMALAFNGVGDALGALNDYQLDPTAENMEQLNQAMLKIGPAGEEFVRFLDSVGPRFAELGMTAREGMFPGMTEGIESFMGLLPQLNRIVSEVAGGIGDLSSSAGADLAGPQWREFFDYLETDARPILVEMGNTFGNFMQGLGSLMVGFAPLTSDFSSGLEDMSASFAEWAATVDETQGFQSFIDYVREVGPMALDFFGSLVMALAELAEAAAPVGAATLPILTGILDVLGALADTPLGSIAVGFLALTSAWGRLNAVASITGSGALRMATTRMRDNLATARLLAPSIGEVGTAFYRAGQAVENQSTKTRLAMTQMSAFTRSAAPMAGQVGLLAVAMSDVDNKMGLTNTTALALAGSLAGPWGTAAGATVGLAMDVKSAVDNMAEAFERTEGVLRSGSVEERTRELGRLQQEIEDFDAGQLVGRAEGQGFFDDLQAEWAIITNSVTGFMDDRRDQRDRLADSLDQLVGREALGGLMQRGLGVTADGFNAATASAEEFRQAVMAVNRALEGRSNMRDYEAAIDDLSASLRENGRTLDIGTEKGRANQAALDTIASTALRVAENMRGMARVRFMDQARDDFVDAATKLGMTGRAARRLADNLGLLDRTVKPKVDADTRAARRQLRETEALIDRLDGKTATGKVDANNKPARDAVRQAQDWLFAWGREDADATAGVDIDPTRRGIQTVHDLLNGWDRDRGTATADLDWSPAAGAMAQLRASLASIPDEVVQIHTVRTGPGGQGAGYSGGADGMTVGGDRWPYGDKVLAYLAPGEEVISNRYGQADRHRDLLKAINANRLADGGTAGALLAASASPSVHVTTPAMSLAGARFVLSVPGLGDVMTRVVRSELAADQTFRERLNDRD